MRISDWSSDVCSSDLALALGETLRNEGATTAVGKSVRVVDAGTDEVSWYITKGACYSACLYSFAGGVQRLITPKGMLPSRLGVHALYLDPLSPDYEHANPPGRWREKLSRLLEPYTTQMGVSPEIVQITEF